MIEVAITVLPELIKALTNVVEDPDTYKKLEGVRQILSKLTGKEIDENGLVKLLEGVTQGDPYTGEWEEIGGETRRLRVEGGWIYDIGRGNAVVVRDK
jgi:hypothetical protein